MKTTNNNSNFAVAVYFGETKEFVSESLVGQFQFNSLLDQAIKFETREEAEETLKSVKEFGESEGWVNCECSVYEFEV